MGSYVVETVTLHPPKIEPPKPTGYRTLRLTEQGAAVLKAIVLNRKVESLFASEINRRTARELAHLVAPWPEVSSLPILEDE